MPSRSLATSHGPDAARPRVRRIALGSLGVCLVAGLVSGVALVTHRETGHLALWHVTQTESREMFARPPVPRTDPPTSPGADLDRARAVALRVMSACGSPTSSKRVRWTTVGGMIRQAQDGAIADCWPRAILFESFAADAGLSARVWALEGDGFQGEAHAVPEVYVSEWQRWAMVDPTLNTIARGPDDAPLGVLELRDRIFTSGAATIYEPIDPEAPHSDAVAAYYAGHVRSSFLRAHALLDDRDRYGALAPWAEVLDRWPERLKKALSAVFGSSGDVYYFHDAHNASLLGRSAEAKAWWVTFLGSVAGGLASALTLARAGPEPHERRA